MSESQSASVVEELEDLMEGGDGDETAPFLGGGGEEEAQEDQQGIDVEGDQQEQPQEDPFQEEEESLFPQGDDEQLTGQYEPLGDGEEEQWADELPPSTEGEAQPLESSERVSQLMATVARLEGELHKSQELVARMQVEADDLHLAREEERALRQKVEALTEERDSVLSLVGDRSQEVDLLTGDCETANARIVELQAEVEALRKNQSAAPPVATTTATTAPVASHGDDELRLVMAERDDAKARVAALESEREKWIVDKEAHQEQRDSGLRRADDLALLEQHRLDLEKVNLALNESMRERDAALHELEALRALGDIKVLKAERDAALQEVGVARSSSNLDAIMAERDVAQKKVALLTVERDGAVERLKRQNNIVTQAQSARQMLQAERDKALAELKAQALLVQQAQEGQQMMAAENQRAWSQLVEKVRHLATLQTERDQLYELANEAEAARAAMEKERDAAIQAQKALGAPKPRGALPGLPPGTVAPAAPAGAKKAGPGPKKVVAKAKGGKGSPAKGDATRVAPAPKSEEEQPQRARSGSGSNSRGRRDTTVAEVGEKAPGRPMPMLEAGVKPIANAPPSAAAPVPVKRGPKKAAGAKSPQSADNSEVAPAARSVPPPTASVPPPASVATPPGPTIPNDVSTTVQSKSVGSPVVSSVRKSVRRLTLDADEAAPPVAVVASVEKQEAPPQQFLSLKERMSALPVDPNSVLPIKEKSAGSETGNKTGVKPSPPRAATQEPSSSAPNPSKAALFAAVNKVAPLSKSPSPARGPGAPTSSSSPKLSRASDSSTSGGAKSPRQGDDVEGGGHMMSLKERMAALPVQDDAAAKSSAQFGVAKAAVAPAKGGASPSKASNINEKK